MQDKVTVVSYTLLGVFGKNHQWKRTISLGGSTREPQLSPPSQGTLFNTLILEIIKRKSVCDIIL